MKKNILKYIVIGQILAIVVIAILFYVFRDQRQFIHTEKSLYRNIFVYEDNGLRCLGFKYTRFTGRQSCMQLSNPDHLVFDYAQMMMAALYINPQPQKILVIGLGGGSLPNALKQILPTAQVDAVEIDPAVIKVAERYFQFSPSAQMHVIAQDGRLYVKQALKQNKKYDLIMLDAYDGEYIPEHMLTSNFLTEVKNILEPNGVLTANTFSTSKLYDSESVTYEKVFGEFVNLKTRNRILLARNNAPIDVAIMKKNAEALDEKFKKIGVDKEMIFSHVVKKPDWNKNAKLLTDQYSPSNLLNH